MQKFFEVTLVLFLENGTREEFFKEVLQLKRAAYEPGYSPSSLSRLYGAKLTN